MTRDSFTDKDMYMIANYLGMEVIIKGEKEYTVTVRVSDKFNNISDPVSVTVKTEPKDYYAEWLNNTILESPGVTFVEIN